MSKRITISDVVNNRQPSKPTAPAHKSVNWRQSLGRLYRLPVIRLLIVLVLAVLPSLYFYHAGKQAEQKTTNSASSSLQTTAAVIKQVSRHILLPSGEQPTVATVSDASKVRNQTFFANSASGDKVLVYAQAKKAYLYRPSIDRVIEVAPLAPSKTGS